MPIGRCLIIIALAATLSLSAQTFAEPNKPVIFPPTIPEGTQPIVLELEVGPRVGEAELVLETVDGTLVGTIATFGFKGRLPSGRPQIPVQRKPEFFGEIEIIGKIVLFGRERAATADELRSVRLVSQ